MSTRIVLLLAIAAASAGGCMAPLAAGHRGGTGGGTIAEQSADRRFVEQAARDGLAEVKLGELAAGKASDPRVKSLARAMLDDFRQIDDQLRRLAAAKGIALPADLDARQRWDYEALDRLCCYEFNRYYTNMMADYLVKEVRRFRHARQGVADPDIRRFAALNVPVLRDQRERAQALVPYFGHGRTDGGDTPQ